jgi:hypothetical protein
VQRQWEASSDYADFHAPAAGDAQMLEFVREVAQQKPEKPDHWSSCSQCERNTSTAEELLEAHAAIAQQSQRKEA